MSDQFQFRQFTVRQSLCAMKVGTDGVLLGAWADIPSAGGDVQLLDVGTGTGIIALMLAQRAPQAHVVAIDLDDAAVRQARMNVVDSPFRDRVEVLPASVQTLAQQPLHQHRYHAVVSNPPYFIDALKAPGSQRTMARHTDSLSYADLMASARLLLADDGELSVIIPFDYRRRLDDEAIFHGFFPSRVCAVRTTPRKSPRRYLLAYRQHPCPCLHQELVIGDATYQQLTRDFYLK